MQGQFEHNIPYVEFELYGFSPQNKVKLRGIVDTGFSGFLQIPIAEAFPIGLILAGTETFTIADGSQKTDLSCLGTITVFDKQAVTSISVGPNSPILIGVQLMAKLGLDARFDFANGDLTFEHNKPRKPAVSHPRVEKTTPKKSSPKPKTK